MRVIDLKINHLFEPVGIDHLEYFSWKITSDKNNTMQESYRIVVTDENRLECIWDSGLVKSRQNTFIRYEGKKLESCKRYYWSVTVCDNNGDKNTAESYFETAFINQSDWKAKWIESSIKRVSESEYKFGDTFSPVLFKKEFTVNKEIASAKCYATSFGVYRIYINDNRPDDREFAPEFTDYAKTLYYQTYDIKKLLSLGENSIDMYVADGWYFSPQASPITKGQHNAPSVIFQIEIDYSDGSHETICSDGTETCELSYIVYSDLFQGEKQDYTLNRCEKSPTVVMDYGYDLLFAQPMNPIRPIKTIPARKIFTSPNGETIVDFGQVLAGRARVNLNLPYGSEITLEYFEVLSSDGNYINTMFAPQKDTVVVGNEKIIHEALFTFHGFRYIRITGIDNPKLEDFSAVLLSTEKENLAKFTCSDEKINKLYHNIRWSQYSNMMSVPTDCPSREKAGWTGDILIYAKTALTNEEMTPFLSSWLSTVRDEQLEDGVITITAPYAKLYHSMFNAACAGFNDDKPTGVAAWSDAIVWVPYDMYSVTGNTLILEKNYDAMKKWCEYIINTAEEKRGYKDIPYEYDKYLWNTGFHFGEWLVPSRPDNTGEQYGICKESAFYVAPFFGYMTIKKMAEISRVLKKKNDEQRYKEYSENMKSAIQNGILRADLLPEYLMGAYVLAFAFDLVPNELQESYSSKLVSLIHEHDDCLDTGFVATPFILDVLCDLGETELASKILWQDKMPSWIYEVDHGATTIWEAWNADASISTGGYVSFNHYAFGCVDDFITRKVVGLDSDTPGFTHIVINPCNMGKLEFASRSFKSENGTINVSWDKKALNVEIPCNTTATVIWNGEKTEVGSGKYIFN